MYVKVRDKVCLKLLFMMGAKKSPEKPMVWGHSENVVGGQIRTILALHPAHGFF
jgi:hypothetical protein